MVTLLTHSSSACRLVRSWLMAKAAKAFGLDFACQCCPDEQTLVTKGLIKVSVRTKCKNVQPKNATLMKEPRLVVVLSS